MAYARNGRNRRSYRRKAARLKNAETICHLCNRPIDPTLDYRHPMSWTADHITPLANGGHVLGELRAAHRSCNSSKGRGQTARVPAADRPTSRAW